MLALNNFLRNDYVFKRLQSHIPVSFRNRENASPLVRYCLMLCGYRNVPQYRTIVFSTRFASQLELDVSSVEKPEEKWLFFPFVKHVLKNLI